jgi:hypothetical protein
MSIEGGEIRKGERCRSKERDMISEGERYEI